MKKPFLFVALFLAGCVGLAYAQVALSPVELVDLKSNGTVMGYFHLTPRPYYWNSPGGLKASGRTLTVGVRDAIQDPDMGVVESANGVLIGTLTARPTCTSAESLRGRFFTQWTANNGGNPDGGIKDLTYQCCKAAAGTYSWVAGFCQ